MGMFENMAGNAPINQLNFMADQGFTAFEDNDMKKKGPKFTKCHGKNNGRERHYHGSFCGTRNLLGQAQPY